MSEPGTAAPGPLPEDILRRGLPPGSRRHLAVLFAGSDAGGAPGALYAFEAELRRVVASESHEAAHARLEWWRAELDRLAGGRPVHPIARALLPAAERTSLDVGLLHELLAAADLDLARFTYRNWAELEAYCFRSSGALQTSIAAVLAGRRPLSAAEREFARRLGSAVRQAEMLQDLPRDGRRGRLYAPLDVLAEHGVEPTALLRDEAGASARSFVESWRGRVRSELLVLPGVLGSPAERRDQRHGLVLAALYAQLLARPVGRRSTARPRFDVEPLSRLWTAWRTAVRHG